MWRNILEGQFSKYYGVSNLGEYMCPMLIYVFKNLDTSNGHFGNRCVSASAVGRNQSLITILIVMITILRLHLSGRKVFGDNCEDARRL